MNVRREELWKDSKNRLKALVYEAVNVLSNGLMSSDQKVAVTSAVHILKTVGLYGEVKGDFGPTAPEKIVWDRTVDMKHERYRALRPDSFCDWSVNNRMEELSKEDTFELMGYWYEQAVDKQRKELREYKKRVKALTQLPEVESVPLTVELIEVVSPEQEDQSKNLMQEPISV